MTITYRLMEAMYNPHLTLWSVPYCCTLLHDIDLIPDGLLSPMYLAATQAQLYDYLECLHA